MVSDYKGFIILLFFRNEGLKFNILAVSTVLFGGFITFLLFKFTGVSIENLVGIMSGAVTIHQV